MSSVKKYDAEYFVSHVNPDLDSAVHMPTNVQEIWRNKLSIINELLVQDLSKVESPIEQLFLIEFNYQQLSDRSRIPNDTFFNLHPQFSVNTGKHTYRVDFKISIDAVDNAIYSSSNSPTETIGFIELDGHDFHEKTKQQVKHDKARERALSDKCDVFLRYSGSEVYQGTHRVVQDAVEHVIRKYKEKIHAFEDS